jgi:hypothetical protein
MKMTIEELEEQLNECQKALAELKESKKEGKWKPKEGEAYWFRLTDGTPYYDIVTVEDYKIHEWRINNIPIFPTKEACEKYWHFMDTVKEKSYEFNDDEWEDDSFYKYHIRRQYYDKKFEVDGYTRTKFLGGIYFKTEEDAQYIIDNFKEELLKYWL